MSPSPTYTPAARLKSRLNDFRTVVNRKYNLRLATYSDLHQFSVSRLNDFWTTFWNFAEIKASVHPLRAVDDVAAIDHFPSFFQGARLNFSENILTDRKNGTAVIDMNESNLASPDHHSWQDLRELVRLYADALRSSNIQRGDVVVLIGSNCIRSLALLLAAGAVGAVFSSFATDMGGKALDDRLQQLHPRMLFAESSYSYNGKRHDISDKLDASIERLRLSGTVDAVVIGSRQLLTSRTCSLNEFQARGTGRTLQFEQMAFDAPFVVMFSSGTTGMPKGIVHSHGGLVTNGMKEFLLHNGIGPGDIHYHYTNIGWTLWNISIGALLVGSSMVLYDGSPFYPSPEEFLQSLFQQKITSFGAGPRYFAELQTRNVRPQKYVTHLHSIVSTGAVLAPPLAQWLAEAFGPVCQVSMSGGTELCGSFLHGTRTLPSYPGELAVKALGMEVAVYSADGQEVPDGESGELVCRKPFPNMPVMVWNDAQRTRYHASYFANFPHVWTHGDFIQINPETRGINVLGRSDGVLNPSGVRFGSSEIYNILAGPRFRTLISDALVVGQQRIGPPYSDPTERVVLFIQCTPRHSSGTVHARPELVKAINEQIASDLSRRHVPSYVFEVPEVPYNANGKKLEIQVKAVLCGGQAALDKLKITKEEARAVGWFVKFYRIEALVKRESQHVGPRL